MNLPRLQVQQPVQSTLRTRQLTGDASAGDVIIPQQSKITTHAR